MTRHTSRIRPRHTLVGLAAAGLVACGSAPTPEAEPSTSSTPGSAATSSPPAEEEGRLSGDLWLNPEGHGPMAVRDAQTQGRADEAETLAPLAEQPTATWFANPDDPFVEVEQLSLDAAESGQLPVLVTYNVPNRDCGSYSSGGAADIDAYLSWVGSFAAALADRPAVVVLEPDAIAQALDGCAGVDPAARYELLTQAVQILDRQPQTRIYLDAGNSDWITDLQALSDALRRSGIAQADGFAVNVSNFQTTEDSAAFGLALSGQLERDGLLGVRFVIDTSRNGAGPLPGRRRPGALVQPARPAPGRRADDVLRAPARRRLLWIKQPGDSDGTCRGGPPAGQWWPPAALELAGG